MNTHKTVSIDMPPELLIQAERFAEQEDRTVSGLFLEALRRYMAENPASIQQEWNAISKRAQARARALGIHTEADVERLSDEFRREQRR